MHLVFDQLVGELFRINKQPTYGFAIPHPTHTVSIDQKSSIHQPLASCHYSLFFCTFAYARVTMWVYFKIQNKCPFPMCSTLDVGINSGEIIKHDEKKSVFTFAFMFFVAFC